MNIQKIDNKIIMSVREPEYDLYELIKNSLTNIGWSIEKESVFNPLPDTSNLNMTTHYVVLTSGN